MTRRKQLTIICGNAGVGKTTLGKRLAERDRALLLDIDTVSEQLVMAGLRAADRNPADRDSPDYKATYREPIHATLVAIANENLDVLPCIIVAPFTQERRDPGFPVALKRALGCPVRILLAWCPDEERRRRIERRNNPRDVAKLARWQDYSEAGRDPSVRPPFAHEFVDTSDDGGSGSSSR